MYVKLAGREKREHIEQFRILSAKFIVRIGNNIQTLPKSYV